VTTGVAEAWRQLSAEGRSEHGWHARRIHPMAVTPILAALRLPGPIKAVLLEVNARSIHPANTFPSSSGFEVGLEALVPGPNGIVRICLQLMDARYEDVFAVLADDVAASVASATSEVAGIAALIGRLNTWQRFLKRHGDGVLSDQERIGLFAELVVLGDLFAKGVAASDAINAWRGPWGGAQDFVLATCSIEVKATLSVHAVSFEVSNLAQLDDRSLPFLLLRHLALTRTHGTGGTLPDMIDAIRRAIVDTDRSAFQQFSDSLLEVGYLDAHRAEYADDSYGVHLERQFLVAGDFPRILSGDVRSGVSACSYAVQLSACLPFLIGEAEANRIIHGASDE
jgi:hypothetical protein